MKNSNKIVIMLLLSLFVSTNPLFSQNEDALVLNQHAKDSLVTKITELLLRNYVYPDKARLMANHIIQNNSNGKYAGISEPSEFARQITRDIRSIYDDTHIRIQFDPQLEKDLLVFLASKKEKQSTKDIAEESRSNFHFRKLEILPGNIGYIAFDGFSEPNSLSRKTVNAAMRFVSNADALILDLRNNFGGNGMMASEIASYFISGKLFTGRSFNRIENKWISEYIENKKSITQGLVLKMPLYILTSERTFSAAEGLAYSLQQFREVTVVGDTTRGGAHLTRSFSAGNGFVAFIPYSRTENAITKTDWEGAGVLPKIVVDDESSSIMVAQNSILESRLNVLKNEEEKRRIGWIINYNKSKFSSVRVNQLEASKFLGRFAEFEISWKDDQLMFRDVNQRKLNYKKMVAISSNLFQVERDYQVEFVVVNGVCDWIMVTWEDGYQEKVVRNK